VGRPDSEEGSGVMVLTAVDFTQLPRKNTMQTVVIIAPINLTVFMYTPFFMKDIPTIVSIIVPFCNNS
jgi:hypothetical protein